jgi:endo-1,4-beta-D-glucanase Y
VPIGPHGDGVACDQEDGALAMSDHHRRFRSPWTFEDHNNACFIVKDATGFAIAYVYYEDETGRRTASELMTRDEARRIAANIAKIPQYRLGDALS